MKYGWAQPQRLAKIRELQVEPTTATYRVTFQGKLHDLAIRTVSIEMPKYRLNNGRTEAAQLEYLATHPKQPRDLFSADLESDAAQVAQNDILASMVPEQDLLAYFKEHPQEDPLIITHTGFVLNGNRRLCAFRMLYVDDPKTYSHFANGQIVVLPPGDEKDFDRLESRLQRERELRAPYPWYADAVKYKRRLGEFDIDEVSAMEGVSKERITELISMLRLADKYLEFIGKSSEYRLLSGGPGGGDAEYAFSVLNKNLGKFKIAEQQEAFTFAAFTLIADPKGGRVYEAIPKLAEHFSYIEAILPKKEPTPAFSPAPSVPTPATPVPPASTPATPGPKTAPVATDIDKLYGASKTESIAPRIEYVRDPQNIETVRGLVRDTIEEREYIKRDTKKQNFVYEQVRKASTLLKEAFNGINESASRDGVRQQLTEVDEYLKKLQAWIDQKPS